MSFRFALPVLAVLSLQGCVAMQMYPGPMKPDAEIAKIIPKFAIYGFHGKEIGVVSFDGSVVGEPLAVLEVLPGRHLVGVRYAGTAGYVTVTNDPSRPCYIVISAEAGNHYQVSGEYLLGEKAWHCWSIDKQTGKRTPGVFLDGELPPREELPALMDEIVTRQAGVSLGTTDMVWNTRFGPIYMGSTPE